MALNVYFFPPVVELFFIQVVIFCFLSPSLSFGSKYDVPPIFVVCYNSSFESFIVNSFYVECVNKVLIHVHLGSVPPPNFLLFRSRSLTAVMFPVGGPPCFFPPWRMIVIAFPHVYVVWLMFHCCGACRSSTTSGGPD